MKKRPDPRHPGDILKYARVRKGFSDEVAMRRLGISKETLHAIEEWNLGKLPDNAHLAPLLRRYCEVVDTPHSKMVKKFPTALKRSAVNLDPSIGKMDERSPWVLSSFLRVSLVLAAVLIVAGYVMWQGSALGSRPYLEIDQSGVVETDDAVFDIDGKSSEGSQVFVNGTPVLVNEKGEFSTRIVLHDGVNVITIRAVNNVGSEREEVITVLHK